MNITAADSALQTALRLRANVRLAKQRASARSVLNASAALSILHELATSASTAPDALALLHELQVLQVELDLQREDLRESRNELEQALARQMRLHDAQPVACLGIDADTRILSANLRSEHLLGCAPASAVGEALAGFLSPASALELHRRVRDAAQAVDAGGSSVWFLHSSQPVLGNLTTDPDGEHFLVVLMPLPAAEPLPKAGLAS